MDFSNEGADPPSVLDEDDKRSLTQHSRMVMKTVLNTADIAIHVHALPHATAPFYLPKCKMCFGSLKLSCHICLQTPKLQPQVN